jgi:hypothetical protein
LVAAVVVVAALAASAVYRNRLRRRPSAALEVHAKPDQHEQVQLLDESSLTGAGVRVTARRDDDVRPVLLEDLP